MEKFEFHPLKSQLNRAKHGIDFMEAQALWRGPTLELRSRNPVESRRLVIGRINGVFYTAIVTDRDEVIRIISVRRSRYEEEKKFSAHHGQEPGGPL